MLEIEVTSKESGKARVSPVGETEIRGGHPLSLMSTDRRSIMHPIQIFLSSILECLETSFSHSSVGKESAGNAGDPGSIPGSGRSPGEGKGNPLQYACLETPMERRAWWATVHGVTRVGHDLAT